jgi:hypothetical protein
MIKVNDTMFDKFLKIMDENDEFLFGDDEFLKNQLEVCLNSQGYWAGCAVRVFYDKDTEEFRVESRF